MQTLFKKKVTLALTIFVLLNIYVFYLCADTLNNKGKAIVDEHTLKQDDEIQAAYRVLPRLENNRMYEDNSADRFMWNSSTASCSEGN